MRRLLKFSWPRDPPYTEADARAFFAHQQQVRRAGHELNFAFTVPDAPEHVLGGGSLYVMFSLLPSDLA